MTWPSARIEAACSLVTDGTHYSPEDVGDGVPFLTVKDMADEGLLFHTAARITRSDYEKAAAGNSAPRLGDVLFSKDGTVGKVHVVTEATQFAVLSSIAILRPRPDIVDPGYLGHVLRSPQVLRRAVSTKTGSALTRIVLKDLKRVSIPLPPLAEQRRIAALLDKADGVRRKRRESLQLLDEFLRSAFLEMFGDPVRNEMGWEQAKLIEVADIVSGVTKGRRLEPGTWKEVPYLRVANVQDARLNLSEIKTIPATDEELEQYQLQRGDVLLTEGGDPDKLGRGAVWEGQIEPCIHQNHVFRVRLTRREFVPAYLAALIGSAYGKRYFLKAAKQTTGIASINKTQLGKFPVLVAPLEQQVKYAQVVERLEQVNQRIQSSGDSADALFDSLAQRAFRGG